MKKYLITKSHYGSSDAINHGLVEIDNKGYVYGETPLEDFGMFCCRDKPFPEDKGEMSKIFLDLMEESAYGLESLLDGKPISQLIKENPERVKDFIYYGGDVRDEVKIELYRRSN